MWYNYYVHNLKIVVVTSTTPTSKEDKYMNTKKNRKEVMQFIRASHEKLYTRLLKEVPNIVEDEWIPLKSEVDLYNSIVKDYCKDYGLALQQQLTL